MPGGSELTRKQLDGWIDWAKGRGAKGLAYVIVEPDGSLRSPLVKFFSEAEIASFAAESGAVPGDLVFLVAAPEREALELLGALRVAVAKDRGLVPEDQWRFLWVTDFPMFEPYGDNDEGWTAVHHPFTAPVDADAATFHEQPGTALARAYDVVLNGSELGGGSIRIHQSEMQQRVFDTIGLTRDEAQSKFGFLLEAFQYGPPPHGGIALGPRPAGGGARRHRRHPRGDGLPQGVLRRRPADRCTHADHGRAAQGSRHRRAARRRLSRCRRTVRGSSRNRKNRTHERWRRARAALGPPADLKPWEGKGRGLDAPSGWLRRQRQGDCHSSRGHGCRWWMHDC